MSEYLGLEYLATLLWIVDKDIKPSVEFDVTEEELETIEAHMKLSFPDLKIYNTRKSYGNFVIAHIYKHPHIKRIIDEIYNTSLYYDADNPVRTVLSAYIYGIPAYKVEEFCKDVDEYE